jgi:2-dehydro-3-deoxygalactonokinase
MIPALLGCDWGTTRLRAWTMSADGAVVDGREFELGVSRLAAGEAQARFIEEIRPALAAQHLPAILCGMIGSNLGWRLAPYVDCPAGAGELATKLMAVEAEGPPVRIVPGLRCHGAFGVADVMRGEETQLVGWLAADPRRRVGRHLVCHPGTHTKWVVLEEGRVARFQTAMTGEMFAVLLAHSVLASPGKADAFDEGVRAAGEGDALLARLFTARGRLVGDGARPETTAAFLSGLLIGSDVASAPGLLQAPAVTIHLLGDADLCR